MVVVGGTYYDGVHLPLHFIEHLAVVRERLRPAVGVLSGVAEAVVAGVNVAIGHEPLPEPLERLHIVAAHKPGSHKAEPYRSFVKFLALLRV